MRLPVPAGDWQQVTMSRRICQEELEVVRIDPFEIPPERECLKLQVAGESPAEDAISRELPSTFLA